MSTRKKILWIEEETLTMLAAFRGYIDASLDYELTVVDNLEEALEYISKINDFHKIILDIRIYESRKNNFDPQNKYGLKFIEEVTNLDIALFSKIVILSNEHSVELELEKYNFPKYQYFSKVSIRSTIMLESKILK